MLRSMLIGLAIAALLAAGSRSVTPAAEMTLAAKRIDWVTVQTTALTKLVCDGYTFLTR